MMQLQRKTFGINWSHIIEQSLIPTVSLFDKAFREVKNSGETDTVKVRSLFYKVLFELTGKAYKAYRVIDKGLRKFEDAKKEVKVL